MDLFNLSGDVAFVTGAGSGIGQRIAVGLAEAGADVGCFDIEASPGLADTVARIEALGRRAVALRGDVTDEGSIAVAVQTLQDSLGALSVAVNCAGIANA
ncbi:MAG: SDR family NAD(P)-dependent oxidoreductase, partial [Janthinobacterium lividum]